MRAPAGTDFEHHGELYRIAKMGGDGDSITYSVFRQKETDSSGEHGQDWEWMDTPDLDSEDAAKTWVTDNLGSRSTEHLSRSSDMPEIKRAIRNTISTEISKGKDPRVAAAVAYREARAKTGKRLAHHDPEEPFEIDPEENPVAFGIYERLEEIEEQLDEIEESIDEHDEESEDEHDEHDEKHDEHDDEEHAADAETPAVADGGEGSAVELPLAVEPESLSIVPVRRHFLEVFSPRWLW